MPETPKPMEYRGPYRLHESHDYSPTVRDARGVCCWVTDLVSTRFLVHAANRLPALEAENERLRKELQPNRSICSAHQQPQMDCPTCCSVELSMLRAEVERLRKALIQARGALRLDAMCDENGEPYGTTQVALDAIDAAIGEST